MSKSLGERFIPELLRACINKKSFFLAIKEHLKVNFIPEKTGYREVWNEISKYHSREEKMPSIGILYQKFNDDELRLECVDEIKKIVKVDYDSLIAEFEDFIRNKRFVELYESVGETYNKGNKEKAYSEFIVGSKELSDFSLKKALHTAVFGNFAERQADRLINSISRDRTIPIGIDLLDHCMNGGPQKGETTLILGDSGVGKSQMLILAGITAARRGFNVAHFQAEGIKQQVMDRYDAAWSGLMYNDIKIGNITDAKYKALLKIAKKLPGEIWVEARDRFGAWSMSEIRSSLIEMLKSYRKIDCVIIDYLDLIDPGDGKVYRANEERFRQQATARLMKDIAVEFDVSVVTVTQASAIPPESREDPDFVLTRFNIAEDKGKIRPFDNFMTINQTRDEKRNRVARIFIDKLREHSVGIDTIRIAQNLSRARFYDRRRTLEELIDDETTELLKHDFQ